MIHATAVVSPKAQIAQNVEIGPFCIVEDDVEIGEGTVLMGHVTIANGARIGKDVRIHPGAVIATAPQDLKYRNEPTLAIIGDRTVIRECATVNRGTASSGKAVVGSDCLLMAYTHVAHDCVVGNNVIMANTVQLGGHVEVGDWAIIGGVTGVHQFCRIGAHTMVGACSRVVKDIPPFTLTGRDPLVVQGINAVGLRRRGFSNEVIEKIDTFYNVILRSGLNTSDGIQHYEDTTPEIDPAVADCITFIRSSKRGVYRGSTTRS
ncbi:MAG: acyl-ACP--UDP-N-acetylglucosamine O-acyltransferase [Ignavibacteria bacterium]|nr:acyl-ACP--UDP-N-acetylglucosamine O-acyltransferase [Ignavibacteria bacterium]MBL0322739.1 acyl-ACP--UDP-N-acetylglucosamine O-acyltransferase [Ignavibacteria bacterium]